MLQHQGDENKRVSHETIDRSLFIQTRGVLKKEWPTHLRATRSIRRFRHATLKRSGLGKFNDAVLIRDRPAEVEDRAVPGHWERDLIAGSGNRFIATLGERHTRFVMLAKVGNKDSHSVIQALIKQSHKLPKELYRSLTWDRGSEMAGKAECCRQTAQQTTSKDTGIRNSRRAFQCKCCVDRLRPPPLAIAA